MSYILAIILLAVKMPLLLAKALFGNKALLVLLVIAALAYVGYSRFSQAGGESAQTPDEQQEKAPSPGYATMVVVTQSRYYMVERMSGDTMLDYYYYDRGEWERGEIPLPVPGEYEIYNRR